MLYFDAMLNNSIEKLTNAVKTLNNKITIICICNLTYKTSVYNVQIQIM